MEAGVTPTKIDPPATSRVTPSVSITKSRAQQTSPLEMSLVDEDSNHLDHQHVMNEKTSDGHESVPHRPNLSNGRESPISTIKQSSSEEHSSTIVADDDEAEIGRELKSITTSVNRPRQIKAPKYASKLPSSSRSTATKHGKASSLKWNSSMHTRKYLSVRLLRQTRRGWLRHSLSLDQRISRTSCH